MSNSIFSPLEIDAIGEISNISLGSSATAISNMLDHRVDITTPSVSVVNAEDFELGSIEPAIGVEIKYVTGLEGSNIMLLKMSDIKVIVDILMGTETPDEEFELNELSLSAACEVMNQLPLLCLIFWVGWLIFPLPKPLTLMTWRPLRMNGCQLHRGRLWLFVLL